MQTLTIPLPDTFDIAHCDLIFILASQLYERGKLSLGQAADMCSLSKRTFIELLGKYGVSVFNYSSEDIKLDYQNA